MSRLTLHLALALALLTGGLGLTGCGHRPAPGTPAAPAAQTISYRISQANDLVSKANNALVKVTISLNQRGAVDDADTRKILDYAEKITVATTSIAKIKDSAIASQEKVAAVRGLLTLLKVPPNVANSSLTDALAAVSVAVLQLMEVN